MEQDNRRERNEGDQVEDARDQSSFPRFPPSAVVSLHSFLALWSCPSPFSIHWKISITARAISAGPGLEVLRLLVLRLRRIHRRRGRSPGGGPLGPDVEHEQAQVRHDRPTDDRVTNAMSPLVTWKPSAAPTTAPTPAAPMPLARIALGVSVRTQPA